MVDNTKLAVSAIQILFTVDKIEQKEYKEVLSKKKERQKAAIAAGASRGRRIRARWASLRETNR